eukprot:TRINITY_DN3066_c0_g4_i1.p1 TRINITY_DN3066_c0_g4~~TRINITY_DN3066_c0_g4_i1.p1  ORF type:complete len:482 (+),score=175.19 TRINITY_DN3066_c0_g4_i1:146-1591(+)
MGPILPKPVTTKVLERKGSNEFYVGVAYMNGFREGMEDAHSVVINDGSGFFGVFDGHCGSNCSIYVAERFTDIMQSKKPPIADDDMRDLSLQIDHAFLSQRVEGGSTGTYCSVEKTAAGYHLQVCNVGDSRVVLGSRKARKCVSLTEDHKPQNTEERARIEAAGGHVSSNRVDGSLAVSRAFGDAPYKGSDQYHSKVIAVPEFTHYDAEVGDFILLCCDGVFEADAFSNEDVIEFIFQKLDKKMDLASVAAAVVDEAMERGSKDNISAMIVQLGGELDCPDSASLKQHEVLAGPYNAPQHQKFRTAYSAMAEHAGLTDAECCELRHDQVRTNLEKRLAQTKCSGKTCDYTTLEHHEMRKLCEMQQLEMPLAIPDTQAAFAQFMKSFAEQGNDEEKDLRPCDVQNYEQELAHMAVPAEIADGAPSEQRTAWFAKWVEEEKSKGVGAGGDGGQAAKLRELQEKCGLPLPFLLNILGGQGGMGQ